MLDTEQVKRAEDFRRKSDETKRAAFEHEILRLEKETELRGTSLAKMLQLKDKHLFEELTKDAESTRKREEELIARRETEIRARLKDEQAKKKARRAEEERLRREEEQERLAREEQLKEESRARAELERRQREEHLRTEEEEEDVQDEEERTRIQEAERGINSVLHSHGETILETEAERRQREMDEERLRQEETMRLQREEFRKREEERMQREAEQRKHEAELRVQEEDDLRREQEIEKLRRQQEEERRQREEEENLRRQEEDRVRMEAEEKLRVEEDLKRQIEERHRQEEEQKRQEAEERLRVEQDMHAQESGNREGRIQELLSNAEAFYAKGNFEHALVEVAKALVNNPSDEAAILLEKKIKEAQGIQEPEEEAKPAHKRSKRRELKPRFERPEKRNVVLARPLYAVGALLIVAVLVIVAVQLKQKIFPVTTTVAILPWTSAANSDQEAALGSSLAEEVARQFYQYNQASALGYASVFGVTRTTAEPEQALFHIGCSYALHGTLTKSALGVSINLRLVDSLGSVRWSERFDRGLASLPSLPAEIAEHVASALELSRDRVPAPPTPTTSPEAYVAYLEGLELLHHHTRSDYLSAADTLQQAVRLDPLFVQALAAASMCYSTMVEENWVPSNTYLGLARDLAEKAVQANPRVGDGFLALGTALTLLRDYTGAADQFAKALKCTPSNSLVFLREGKNLLRVGRYKEAVKALGRAYDLDPRNPEILETLGFANELSGTSEQGASYLLAALPFVPDSVDYLIGPINDAILLNPELSLSQSARVISACEHRIVQNPDDFATIYRLSRTLQVTGKRIEGTTLLDKLEKDLRTKLKSDPNNSTAMIYLALTLTRMGKFPEATSWGQKAIDLHPRDPIICFRLAQMYSLQMYSPQRKKIDEQKKTESIKALKQALRLNYRFDELTNADFYNMYEHGNFASVIATNPQ